jgi:transcriptional regulator
MYVPEHFALTSEQSLQALAGVVAGDLVTIGPDGPEATFVPMLHEPGGQFGVLTGHLSRINPQWQHPGPALFIVHGPGHYIAADWLSRPGATSVPTWNYLTVHASGELVVHPEPDWCAESVRRLSAARGDHTVDRLPQAEVDRLLRSVIGIELRITRLAGKAKMSQNKPPEVIGQVIDGLERTGGDATADWMLENSLPRAQAKADLLTGIRRRHTQLPEPGEGIGSPGAFDHR